MSGAMMTVQTTQLGAVLPLYRGPVSLAELSPPLLVGSVSCADAINSNPRSSAGRWV